MKNMSVEITSLYQPDIPPEAVDRARPPQEKLPIPPHMGPSLIDSITNWPAYLVERGNPQAFQVERAVAQRALTEKAVLTGSLFWRRQMIRTVLNTGWKILLYGGLGTGVLWGITRLITGY